MPNKEDKNKSDSQFNKVKIKTTVLRQSELRFVKANIIALVKNEARMLSGYNTTTEFENEEVKFHRDGSISVILTNPKNLVPASTQA